MQRIAIIGNGGAGKSTLALELGERLSIPVHHLDQLFWRSGWERLTQDEFRRAQQEILATPSWIMDGNYGSTMDLRLAAADSIVFVDPRPVVCIWRLFRRYLRFSGRSRPDMTSGCPERLTWEFLWYVLGYRRTRRPGILQRLKRLASEREFFVLRSGADIRRFLRGLPGVVSASPPAAANENRDPADGLTRSRNS